jgi:hypothetical protein
MKRIPSDEIILQLLDRLDEVPVDALESEVLDFKRWEGANNSLSEAVELAVCFANAEGGSPSLVSKIASRAEQAPLRVASATI